VQNPIVVVLSKQPAVTPEITYTQVIVGAIGAAGLIMLAAAVIGLLTGAVIIFFKKRAEAASTSTETEHVELKLSR
jgi:hypothetical protein